MDALAIPNRPPEHPLSLIRNRSNAKGKPVPVSPPGPHHKAATVGHADRRQSGSSSARSGAEKQRARRLPLCDLCVLCGKLPRRPPPLRRFVASSLPPPPCLAPSAPRSRPRALPGEAPPALEAFPSAWPAPHKHAPPGHASSPQPLFTIQALTTIRPYQGCKPCRCPCSRTGPWQCAGPAWFRSFRGCRARGSCTAIAIPTVQLPAVRNAPSNDQMRSWPGCCAHHALILNRRPCSPSSCRVRTISLASNTEPSFSPRLGRSASIKVMTGWMPRSAY